MQQAAGIYGHLKDVTLSHVQQDPTPDLSPDTLNALASLMVAQGQEAIYRKAATSKCSVVDRNSEFHRGVEYWMGDFGFTSFSTVFKLYQDNGRVIMKGCVLWKPIYS